MRVIGRRVIITVSRVVVWKTLYRLSVNPSGNQNCESISYIVSLVICLRLTRFSKIYIIKHLSCFCSGSYGYPDRTPHGVYSYGSTVRVWSDRMGMLKWSDFHTVFVSTNKSQDKKSKLFYTEIFKKKKKKKNTKKEMPLQCFMACTGSLMS